MSEDIEYDALDEPTCENCGEVESECYCEAYEEEIDEQ